MAPRSGRAAHLLFALVAAAVAVTAALAGREIASLVATSSATAIVGHQVLTRRVHELAWRAILAGMALFTVDAATTVAQTVVGGADEPSGPVAGVVVPLAFAVLLAGGLLLVSPRRRRNLGAVLDATLTGIACTVVLWSVALQPQLVRAEATIARTVASVLIVLALGR